jgi:hypothetical protein
MFGWFRRKPAVMVEVKEERAESPRVCPPGLLTVTELRVEASAKQRDDEIDRLLDRVQNWNPFISRMDARNAVVRACLNHQLRSLQIFADEE